MATWDEIKHLLIKQPWRIVHSDDCTYDVQPASNVPRNARLPHWRFSHFECQMLGLGTRTFKDPNMLLSILDLVQRHKRHCICKSLLIYYTSRSSPSYVKVQCSFYSIHDKAWRIDAIEMQPSQVTINTSMMATMINGALQQLKPSHMLLSY